MQSKMRKEILTREQIKKEIRYICINSIISNSPLTIIFLMLVLFFTELYLCYRPPFYFLIIPIIICSLLLLLIIWGFCYFLKLFTAVDKGKFTITIDKLVNIKEAQRPYAPIRSKTVFITSLELFSDPYCLYFSSLKKYRIPRGKNYEWSEKHCMDHLGVFRSASIGDEFYLVKNDKERIILVYNTNFFQFLQT